MKTGLQEESEECPKYFFGIEEMKKELQEESEGHYYPFFEIEEMKTGLQENSVSILGPSENTLVFDFDSLKNGYCREYNF